MITFQAIMFVSLGFLAAVLLGFVVAPAFWARAVRLTSERMRASLPLTEREIRAEHDRVRAENAIRIYRLGAERDKARLSEARQTVEVNRRDAAIGQLERRLHRIETENEASENARRVLEATLKERMPELEKRLVEARQLLAHRDSEMKSLREDASKTYRALDEAMQINAQQRSEIDRLKTSLSVRTGRPASQPQAAETEAALRAELERLRVRTRDQGDVIQRLQNRARSGSREQQAKTSDTPGGAADPQRAQELAIVQEGFEASREALLVQVRTLSKKVGEQADEISDLKRQLVEVEAAGAGHAGAKKALRSDMAKVNARISAKDQEIAERDKTIASLRRELAMANERIARQASYYMEELRRLGTGGARRAEKRNGAGGANGTRPGDGTRGAEVVQAELAEARVEVDETASAGATSRRASRLSDETDNAGKAAGDGTGRPNDDVAEVGESRPKLMDRIAGIAKR